MTRWSTYRLIINSQMPLNVNFFCGDWRIAIVTEEWKVIELFLISSIAARWDNYSTLCSCRAAWRPMKIPLMAVAAFPKFSLLLWQFRNAWRLNFCPRRATRHILLYSGGSAWLFCLTLVHNFKKMPISPRLTIIPHDARIRAGAKLTYKCRPLFQATKMFSNPPRNLCLISQKSCNWMDGDKTLCTT